MTGQHQVEGAGVVVLVVASSGSGGQPSDDQRSQVNGNVRWAHDGRKETGRQVGGFRRRRRRRRRRGGKWEVGG